MKLIQILSKVSAVELSYLNKVRGLVVFVFTKKIQELEGAVKELREDK